MYYVTNKTTILLILLSKEKEVLHTGLDMYLDKAEAEAPIVNEMKLHMRL